MTDQEIKEHINLISLKDWERLFDLIPEIESTKVFGDVIGGINEDEGVIKLPFYSPKPIVDKFYEIVYELPIIIGFNWASWDEGRKIVRSKNFDFDTIDIPTKCMMITAIVRNDRFCDGALISAFNSGLILKILKSMKKQIG